MRQIVQKSRPIVRDSPLEGYASSALNSLVHGKANAAVWCGDTRWFEWNLSHAIGFLLVTRGHIETTCEQGVSSVLGEGDLLVINRSGSTQVRLKLDLYPTRPMAGSRDTYSLARRTDDLCAVIGHLELNATPNIFSNEPQHSMARIPLTIRETKRIHDLGKILEAEPTTASTHNVAQNCTVKHHLQHALFQSVADVLCQCDPISVPQIAAASDQRISNALLAMTKNPAYPWRVESLAHEAALSRTAFAVRFKHLLGQTPLEYLTRLRAQLAITLMHSQPQLRLNDVAMRVGYADESALRRVLKKLNALPNQTIDALHEVAA